MTNSNCWIDGHLDLAYLAMRGRELTRDIEDPQAACISLPALRAADVRIVLATIYIDIGEPDTPWGYASSDDADGAARAALRQIEYYQNLEARGEVSIVRSAGDLDRDTPLPKLVILMEGCDPVRSPVDVSAWFDRGVRIFGLTWAKGSRYAGGNAAPGPLTGPGRDVVAAIDDAGGVHDISHLSDPAVHELFEIAHRPIVASHSNCRGLMPGRDQRHLTNEMIREISSRGGVIGLNLYGRFLADGRRATIHDCLRHLQHIRDTAGSSDVPALGSDADGGFPPTEMPIDLDAPVKYRNLIRTLESAEWSESERAAFAHQNWLRFLKSALPPT